MDSAEKAKRVPVGAALDADNIADRLKRIRKSEKLNQKEMADKLGLSMRSYNYYEKGERDLRATEIIKILMLWDIDAHWFLLGESAASHNEEKK